MVVSTESISSEMPRSACCMRRLPSNANGLVTTATVSAPISLASEAMIGRGAGAGAAAEAGGDEHHVGAFERFDDLVGIFERGLASDFGIGAGAQAVGELHAELDLHGRARHAQRLQVGVGDDEFDAFHAGVDHAVDGVAAAAAYADDFDLGVVAGVFVEADANVGFFFFHVRRLSVDFLARS